jgi:ribosomal protein L40E
MKREWIKLYTAILDDDRMRTMSDHLWYLTIELFLLVGERGGLLDTVERVAWRIRVQDSDPERLLEDLKKLETFGIVYETVDGWIVRSEKELFFPIDPHYNEKRARWSVVRKIIAPWVFFRHGKVCAKCGATEDITIDHIIPIAKDGTNDLTNLQVLCRKCNASKGARI